MKHQLLLVFLILLSCACHAASALVKVPRYAKFEASFTLPNQTGNPFDPQVNDIDVTFTGPSRLHVTVPAFWDGDRWRVRYAPPQVGEYALSIMRNGQAVKAIGLTEARFRCVPSADAGFIRRDPKVVQRFVFNDGKVYYPLGMNVAWTGGNAPDYPTYFADMGQAHMNWARVWMTYWDGKALEWSPDKSKDPPIGFFLMDAARRWDMIFDNAAKDGIYIQMVLQHHGQYTEHTDPNWADNPFNVANGGFLKHPDDFFTDPEAARLTRSKYRYIVARWGYSTHLLSFELFNEVQNITEARSHFQDVVNWHKEMAAYIRSIDVDRHLITTSNSDPGTPLAQIGLDYDQIHTYPPDIVSTFAAVRTAAVPVPVFYGEWGRGGSGPQTEQSLHDGLWASLMDPTAGAGQFWYWDQVLPNDWWPQYASATGFVRMLDARSLGEMSPTSVLVSSTGPRAALSFAPPEGWGTTTNTDVTLPADGSTPDLRGISSFIQGSGHRDMLPQPIVFHLDCAAPCRFVVQVGVVAKAGADVSLALDGGAPQVTQFTTSDKDHNADQTVSVDVPVGAHTVSLFNTGPDWFTAQQISVTGYVPAVAALAKGDRHTAVFWAYARDRDASAPVAASLLVPGLAPGRYMVRLWNPWSGKTAGVVQAVSEGGGVHVTLSRISRDVAGVVTAK